MDEDKSLTLVVAPLEIELDHGLEQKGIIRPNR